MNKITLREIQLLELSILKKFVEFLDANNYPYILAGGSMLGAVRHGGFIPWDDDIDILVPRYYYEIIKKSAKKNRKIDNNIEFRIPGDKNYPYSFIKIVDKRYRVINSIHDEPIIDYLWIDVFPLDHFPDNENNHKKWFKKINQLNSILSSCSFSKEYKKTHGYYSKFYFIIKNFIKSIIFILTGKGRMLSIMVDNLACKMDKKYYSSRHVGDGAWPNGLKDYFKIEDCFPTIKIEFEGNEFCIPKNYDSYLTKFYGDYMKIPNEKDRVTHSFTVEKIVDDDLL